MDIVERGRERERVSVDKGSVVIFRLIIGVLLISNDMYELISNDMYEVII